MFRTARDIELQFFDRRQFQVDLAGIILAAMGTGRGIQDAREGIAGFLILRSRIAGPNPYRSSRASAPIATVRGDAIPHYTRAHINRAGDWLAVKLHHRN